VTLDPYNLTPNASINRVKLMSAPGLPDKWRGKTAYQVIGREGLVQRISEAFPELADSPDPIPLFSQKYLTQGHQSALVIAEEMGVALGCLLLTLKLGEVANREARPQWDDSYWTYWGSIQHVILGGGLMAGLLGQYVLAKATHMLSGLMSLTIANYPSSLPLIGAARMATDTTNSVWVFDFGGTNVKRARAIYDQNALAALDQSPSVFVPAFDQTLDLFKFMSQTIATTISSTDSTPQPVAIYVSIANYAQGCRLADDNPYSRLNSLGSDICSLLSEAVTSQLGYQATIATFVHDGTAAAKAYAGASNTAVITIGTALGMGFPPSDQFLRPLSPTFSIKPIL
jgi:hypothetical protein